MKTLLNAIAMTFVLGFASSLSAQRANEVIPLKTYKKADTVESIQSMKMGDRYALVCKESGNITLKEVTDQKDVEAMSKDGGSFHCEACNKKVTVKITGHRPDEPTITRVTYVNAEGKECMVVVPLKG